MVTILSIIVDTNIHGCHVHYLVSFLIFFVDIVTLEILLVLITINEICNLKMKVNLLYNYPELFYYLFIFVGTILLLYKNILE